MRKIIFIILFIIMCVSYAPKIKAHSDYSDINPCFLGLAACTMLVMENNTSYEQGEGR